MKKQHKPVDIKVLNKNLLDNSYDILISTASVDSDKDTIEQDGWILDRYLKNPVVMWAHDYYGQTPSGGVPVGKSNKITLDRQGLISNFTFRKPANEHDFVLVVQAAWEDEVLRAGSVGFAPVEWTRNEERGGIDFQKQELLEWSIVSIPANPDALRRSYEMAIKSAGYPELLGNPEYDEDKNLYVVEWDNEGKSEVYPSGTVVSYTETTGSTDNVVISASDDTKDLTYLPEGADFVDDRPDEEISEDGGAEEKTPIAWTRIVNFKNKISGEKYSPRMVTFYQESIDVPEDAEKMYIEPNGNLGTMTHPDAGQIVTYTNGFITPPLESDEDTFYYVSARAQEKDIDVFGTIEDLEIEDYTDVLSILEGEKVHREYGKTLQLCRINTREINIVKNKMLKLKTKRGDVHVQKEGRVLSKRNEDKIKQAKQLLEDVLADLPDEQIEELEGDNDDRKFYINLLEILEENTNE